MMARTTAAIVGCGRRASAYVEACRDIAGVTPTACYAPTPRRRERFAAKHGLRAYDDLDALLHAEKPDVVHLVTWPDVRVGLMERIADSGVPAATVEKPLATTEADVQRLRELSQTATTKFAVCHQLRWHPTLVRCREAIAADRIGRPLFVEMSARLDLFSQGTHALSYGRYLLGEPAIRRVTGHAHGVHAAEGGQSCPATTLGYLELEGPVRAVWSTGAISPPVSDGGAPWQHLRVRVFGERGQVTFAELGASAIVASGEEEAFAPPHLHAYKEHSQEAQAGFQRAVLQWLSGDAPAPGTCLSESLHETEVLLATIESGRSGLPVEIQRHGAPATAGAREFGGGEER